MKEDEIAIESAKNLRTMFRYGMIMMLVSALISMGFIAGTVFLIRFIMTM